MRYEIDTLLAGARVHEENSLRNLSEKLQGDNHKLYNDVRHAREELDLDVRHFVEAYGAEDDYFDRVKVVEDFLEKMWKRTGTGSALKSRDRQVDKTSDQLQKLIEGEKPGLVLWLEAVRATGETHVSSNSIKEAGLNLALANTYMLLSQKA